MRFGKPVLLLLALFVANGVFAESTGGPELTHTEGGEKACLDCHDNPGITGILQGPHFIAADPRSAAGNHACEACHGPGEEHTKFPLEISSMRFDSRNDLAVEAESGVCLTCHQGRTAGVTVETATAGLEIDEPNAELRFINPHYATSAATWWRSSTWRRTR